MTNEIKINYKAIEETKQSLSLVGKMLLASPQMEEPRYARSLLIIYEQNEQATKGFLVNRLSDKVTFPELARQLGIEAKEPPSPPIYQGGQQDASRGFVLHSDDRRYRNSQQIAKGLCWTGTIDPLTDIANHSGPSKRLVLLGHSYWAENALEREISQNLWFSADLDFEIIFSEANEVKWQRAIHKLLPNPGRLSNQLGNA